MPSSAAPRTTDRPASASRSSTARAPGTSRSSSSRDRTRSSPASTPSSVVRAGGGSPPGLEARDRGRHVGVGPLPIGPVVVGEEREPDRSGLPLLQQVPDEHQVAEGLRHLLPSEPDDPDMQPMADELGSGDRLGLRGLAFVMGEDEVPSAPVDVDRLAQLAQHHRGALDMPSRASRSPPRLPRGFVGQGRLPEHEVERMPLVGVVGVAAVLAGERQHRRLVEMAELPETRGTCHVEVDSAPRLVGGAVVEDRADQGEDLCDRGGGARLGPRGNQPERRPCPNRTSRSPPPRDRGSGRRARAPCGGCRRRRR